MQEVIFHRKKFKELGAMIYCLLGLITIVVIMLKFYGRLGILILVIMSLLLLMLGVGFFFLLYIQIATHVRGFGFVNMKLKDDGIETLSHGLITWQYIDKVTISERNENRNLLIWIKDMKEFLYSKKDELAAEKIANSDCEFVEVLMMNSKDDIDGIAELVRSKLNES